jgi:hypothetical protein
MALIDRFRFLAVSLDPHSIGPVDGDCFNISLNRFLTSDSCRQYAPCHKCYGAIQSLLVTNGIFAKTFD